MTSLAVSLPDDIKRLAEQQVARGRYANISEYVADLIRQDQEREPDEPEVVILKERVRSNTAGELTETDFDAIRQRLQAEISRRRQAAGKPPMIACRNSAP